MPACECTPCHDAVRATCVASAASSAVNPLAMNAALTTASCVSVSSTKYVSPGSLAHGCGTAAGSAPPTTTWRATRHTRCIACATAVPPCRRCSACTNAAAACCGSVRVTECAAVPAVWAVASATQCGRTESTECGSAGVRLWPVATSQWPARVLGAGRCSLPACLRASQWSHCQGLRSPVSHAELQILSFSSGFDCGMRIGLLQIQSGSDWEFLVSAGAFSWSNEVRVRWIPINILTTVLPEGSTSVGSRRRPILLLFSLNHECIFSAKRGDS